jgi:hypothetical protein
MEKGSEAERVVGGITQVSDHPWPFIGEEQNVLGSEFGKPY